MVRVLWMEVDGRFPLLFLIQAVINTVSVLCLLFSGTIRFLVMVNMMLLDLICFIKTCQMFGPSGFNQRETFRSVSL